MTRRRKLLVTMLLVGIVGAGAGSATYSAFTSTTGNGGNVFSAGTVNLTDNDGGSTSLLALSNAKPGDADTGCIAVSTTAHCRRRFASTRVSPEPYRST